MMMSNGIKRISDCGKYGYFMINCQAMNCRICGKPLSCVEIFNVSAYHCEYTPKPISLNKYATNLFFCNDCHHFQIHYLLSNDFYDNYIYDENITNNTTIWNYQEQLQLLESRANSKNLFLEIGCGIGNVLEIVKDRYTNVLGIEPSEEWCLLLEQKKIPYIKGYFKKELIAERKCDVFFSTQVFEHLENPLEVLKDIHAVCNDGAVGCIIVPDGQKLWEEKTYNGLISQHINYFSPLSLSLLAYKAGFLVDNCNIKYYNDDSVRNIVAILRKSKAADSFSAIANEFHVRLSRLPKNKKISAFGAGGKALFLLPVIEEFIELNCVYDSDTKKQNKFAPGCTKKIINPTRESILQNDIIILLGSRHDESIRDDLLNKYGYMGEIFYA